MQTPIIHTLPNTHKFYRYWLAEDWKVSFCGKCGVISIRRKISPESIKQLFYFPSDLSCESKENKSQIKMDCGSDLIDILKNLHTCRGRKYMISNKIDIQL